MRVALKSAAATMAAALAAYGSVLWLSHAVLLRVDAVVLAVVLAVALGRPVARTDWVDRAVGLVLVPAVTLGASETARLMTDRVIIGSTLFAVLVAATIFVRRWGPRCTTAGALATAPLLAMLIVPTLPTARTNMWWTLLVAVIAYAWSATLPSLVQANSERKSHSCPGGTPGFNATVGDRRLLGAERQPVTDSPTEPERKSHSCPGGPPISSLPVGTDKSRRARVSLRMAVQMGVALGVAFVGGHLLLGEHWAWMVLTAFVVCSGNRGRGDVVRKGLLRVVGATVGTGLATLLSGLFGPADPWQVVAIFVLLAIGTWLRELSYAYWAAAVTAALAFLYGYFGQAAPGLLVTRLGGILLGGLVGVAASWFVLPVRGREITAFRPWLARVCATVCRPIRRGPRLP